jgi:hypothetical protein
MKPRYKFAGVLSALALTATLGIGQVSADSETQIINATLGSAANVCTIDITGGSGDLGVYTWTGSAYSAPSTAVTGHIDGLIDSQGTPGDRDCDITVSATDMTLNGSGSGLPAFTKSQIEISSGGEPWQNLGSPVGPTTFFDVPVGGQPGSTDIRLNGAPNQNAVPGNYKATITVEVVEAP